MEFSLSSHFASIELFSDIFTVKYDCVLIMANGNNNHIEGIAIQ